MEGSPPKDINGTWNPDKYEMRNKLLLPILLLALSLTACLNQENQKPRPNIVFIMSDDHAYQAISAYSDKLIQTPNIDRIAVEGMLFSNASVTNSICAPSRATILTGKHCHLHGKIDNRFPFDTTQITFPQLFQAANHAETPAKGRVPDGHVREAPFREQSQGNR